RVQHYLFSVLCFAQLRLQSISTLFPYTTLFRSDDTGDSEGGAVVYGDAYGWFIALQVGHGYVLKPACGAKGVGDAQGRFVGFGRSEEHTSELQSRENLVCRLLLEKKKATDNGDV